ncbi:MAG: hypothetical protein RIQ54_141 [Candidatus Parcubacteria bacterium]|jgi:uncharacterized protein YqfB (UPF0267 family)
MSSSVVEVRYTFQEGGWSRAEWSEALQNGLTPYGKEVKEIALPKDGAIEFRDEYVAFYQIGGKAVIPMREDDKIIIRSVAQRAGQGITFEIIAQNKGIQINLGDQEFVYVIKIIDPKKKKSISRGVMLSTVPLSVLRQD